jgi:hypothetical protein
MVGPLLVVVAAIDSALTAGLVAGGRAGSSKDAGDRRSILFHVDLPGRRWQASMLSPVSVAGAASSVFHSRVS